MAPLLIPGEAESPPFSPLLPTESGQQFFRLMACIDAVCLFAATNVLLEDDI